MDNPELDPGFRLDAFRSGLAQTYGQSGALPQRVAPRAHHHPIDRYASRSDELGGGHPGDVGQHGHRPIDPDTGEQRRHLDLERPGFAHARAPVGRPTSTGTARTTTPTVMHASATLKVGQWLRVK